MLTAERAERAKDSMESVTITFLKMQINADALGTQQMTNNVNYISHQMLNNV